MPKGTFLGEFEMLVLAALMRLGPNAYGVRVRQEIERETGRDVSIGAVYATLDRLERKGYVRSELGDPTPTRGGRAKRFFRIRATGVRALRTSVQALGRLVDGLRLDGSPA